MHWLLGRIFNGCVDAVEDICHGAMTQERATNEENRSK